MPVSSVRQEQLSQREQGFLNPQFWDAADPRIRDRHAIDPGGLPSNALSA